MYLNAVWEFSCNTRMEPQKSPHRRDSDRRMLVLIMISWCCFNSSNTLFMKSTIFLNITQCSPLKVNRRFGGKYLLHLQGRRISRARTSVKAVIATCFYAGSCLAYSSTLKMVAICSSETSVDFQRSTRRYIPEDSTLHNHRCENLKSYFISLLNQPVRIAMLSYIALNAKP
jgi:hypothetical protein